MANQQLMMMAMNSRGLMCRHSASSGVRSFALHHRLRSFPSCVEFLHFETGGDQFLPVHPPAEPKGRAPPSKAVVAGVGADVFRCFPRDEQSDGAHPGVGFAVLLEHEGLCHEAQILRN